MLGAVSIALALSVPENIPGRDVIVASVFGTVLLFTLLVQAGRLDRELSLLMEVDTTEQ